MVNAARKGRVRSPKAAQARPRACAFEATNESNKRSGVPKRAKGASQVHKSGPGMMNSQGLKCTAFAAMSATIAATTSQRTATKRNTIPAFSSRTICLVVKPDVSGTP